MTVVGFLESTRASLVANPNIIQKTLGGISSLDKYLDESEIKQEIDKIMNPRLADNFAILGVIQKKVLNGADRRDVLLSEMSIKDLTEKFTLEETER